MKQVLYLSQTNIRRHYTKFSRHGDLANGARDLCTLTVLYV